jgi:hypothetical protein
MAVSPATLEYLKWYEVLITFDRGDHSNFIPKSCQYPLIVSPIVKVSSSIESLLLVAAP